MNYNQQEPPNLRTSQLTYAKLFQCSLLSPVKIAQDMAVFRHLASHDTATADELAELTGADRSFVGTYATVKFVE
jgi:hypothetical protein